MSKKAFNLGDYLRTEPVSKTDTAEQLVRIPVEDIVPDPGNFYSLDGIEDLAGNIELIGLQQPLRVRPDGKRFIVVSGHRRLEAIKRIREDNPDAFPLGVPCLVDYGEASEAMRELRLIFANSSTRVMTSAETAKQAERVTELLYQLKEQGVEFPGRMRDHVAEACRISASKLARLNAIRSNLIDAYRLAWDAGKLSEASAYRLSQETPKTQREIFTRVGLVPCTVTTADLDKVIEQVKRPAEPEKPAAKPAEAAEIRDAVSGYLEQRAQEDATFRDLLLQETGSFMPHLEGVCTRQDGIEMLKKALGRNHVGWTHIAGGSGACSPKGAELWSRESPRILRTWTDVYDMLSTIAINAWISAQLRDEYEEEEAEAARVFKMDTEPKWYEGDTPPREGRYLARVDMGEGSGVHEATCEWRGGSWSAFGGPLYEGMKVVAWWPLPEKRIL